MPANRIMPMSEDMRKRFDEIFKDVPRRNVDRNLQCRCINGCAHCEGLKKNERVLVKDIKG